MACEALPDVSRLGAFYGQLNARMQDLIKISGNDDNVDVHLAYRYRFADTTVE